MIELVIYERDRKGRLTDKKLTFENESAEEIGKFYERHTDINIARKINERREKKAAEGKE